MSAKKISRRGFLRGVATGTVAAPLLGQLAVVRDAFADALPAAASADASPFAGLRASYRLDPGVTYLNHASIGTSPAAVMEAHRGYLERCEANPWLYMWGGEWEGPREEVRGKAADLLRCKSSEVAITHNTTEAFNILALGLPLEPGDEVLFSSLNHSGASVAWEHQAAARGFTVRRFELPEEGAPSWTEADVLELYERQLGPKTRVLVLPHVDNRVGLRHPVAKLAALARSKGVRYVAVDGAQTIGMVPVDVGVLGVDLYATSAHKWLQAPKGLGLAYVREGLETELRPFWVTWGQGRWAGSARIFEDYGTRNLPAVLALGDALDFQRHLGEEAKEAHHRRLWEHARGLAGDSPVAAWASPSSWDLSAALYAVEVRDGRAGQLAQKLFRERGFVVRPFESGSRGVLRLSPNVANTPGDLDHFFTALEELAATGSAD